MLLPHTPHVGTTLVLRVERRWMPRCGGCGALCRVTHSIEKTRRWKDLPWAGHPVEIEATPIRVVCHRCGGHPVEMLAWADRYQRETRRLQQHLALQAASMPVMHVAVLNGLSWSTVHRAERHALERWAANRPAIPLTQVGVDEKYRGRRHKGEYRFHTVVSNLDTGEPIWIGPGRDEETLSAWLRTLTPAEKKKIDVFAMDMHRPFYNAVRADPELASAVTCHDPFHIMKRAGKAISDIRKETFFRAGTKMRGIGRGKHWLVLRAWDNCSPQQQAQLRMLFSYNRQLGRAYQIVEELRDVVTNAPDGASLDIGLARVLRRTQLRSNKHLRKLHDSLVEHRQEIFALGEYRPPAGRIEALNNNWETLVRRGRGYRNYDHFLLKLRFMTANPIRSKEGTQRFLALGLQSPPLRQTA
jgi:transposase